MNSTTSGCSPVASLKERAIEAWVRNFDIKLEIAAGNSNGEAIVKDLFSCLEEYPKSIEIQSRSYDLLNEVQILLGGCFDGGIDRHMEVAVRSLNRWASHGDIVSGCFEYLAIASEKSGGSAEEFFSLDVLHIVCTALEEHKQSERVQQPGMQILHHFLLQRMVQLTKLSMKDLKRIRRIAIYNIRFYSEDIGIIRICCAVLEVLIRAISQDDLTDIFDDTIVLVSETFHRYHDTIEVASSCLLIIGNIASDQRQYNTLCSDSEQLLHICDCLTGMKNDKEYHKSLLSAVRLLSALLTDEGILPHILSGDYESRKVFISNLQSYLVGTLSDVGDYCDNSTLSPRDHYELLILAGDILHKMQSIIQTSEAAYIASMCGVSADHVEGRGRTSNGTNHSSRQTKRSPLQLHEHHVTSNTSDCDDLDCSSTASASSDNGCLNVHDSSCSGEQRNSKIKSTSAHSSDQEHSSSQDANTIVEVALRSQHQAAVALVSADIMHKLFIDATMKIETLMRESDGLRAEIETLKSSNSVDDVDCYDNGGDGINDEGISSIAAADNSTTAIVAAQDKHLESACRGNASPDMNIIRSSDTHHLKEINTKVAVDSHSGCESESLDDTRHEDTSCSSLSVTQEYTLPACSGSKINRTLSTSSWSADHDDKRISLAVAGMIEAISVLKCPNTTQSRYETAMTDESRKSLLQHGRAMITSEEWVKYEPIGDIYHINSGVLSAVVVEELGHLMLQAFRHLKKCEMTGSCGLLKQSALSFATVRMLLREIPQFLKRDVDILFRRLGVKYLSISGFTYSMMALTIQRYPNLSLAALLTKLSDLLKRYLADFLDLPLESSLLQYEDVCGRFDELEEKDMGALLSMFDKNKGVLHAVFNSYIETPTYQPTGSKLDRKSRPIKITACSVKVGRDHAFIETASMKVKAAPVCAASHGVSLMGAKQFAMDFDLHPTVLPPSLLFQIFEEVLGSVARLSPPGDLCRSSSERHFFPPAGRRNNYGTNSGPKIDDTSHSNEQYNVTHGEPLLTIDQFHGLLVGIALRSTYFRNLADDIRHAEEVASPPLMRRLLMTSEGREGFALKNAITKLNCLIAWLNKSRGQRRLSERLRSISASEIAFRPIG